MPLSISVIDLWLLIHLPRFPVKHVYMYHCRSLLSWSSGCCLHSNPRMFFDQPVTDMLKLSITELEPFYTHQTLSVIFYRGGLWIFHYVLYYNTYIVARWDNLCFRTSLHCCTDGVTPLYQYLMDSGMKHYNQ